VNVSRRIALVLFPLFLLAGAGHAAAAPLPFNLDQVTSIAQARETLLGLRDSGAINQARMMELARALEPRLRGDEMAGLGIMDAGRNRFAIERAGTSPFSGRGIFSDEDLQLKNIEQMQRVLKWAKEKGYKVTGGNRYLFKIEKLDTVVWKPGQYVPGHNGAAGTIESSLAQSLEPEFASGAKPGSRPHPLESSLENTTKGSKGLFEKLPKGYQAELEIVAGAKDVLRSMQAAGMCNGDRARICRNLDDLRKMRKSPSELGLGNLDDAQLKLRKLMMEAFRESEQQFAAEFEELSGRLRKAGSAVERDTLLRQAAEMRERAIRMGTRFEVLSNQHPEMMRELSGGKTPRAFWGEQTEKIRLLNEGAESAAGNVTRARSLNVVLNLAVFAQCMQEEKSARREARLRQAGKCTLQAAGGLAFGELVSQGIGYLTFVAPSGAVIATAGLTTAGILYSSYQIYEAGEAYCDMREAEREADASEQALQRSQQGNVMRFPERFAAEEALVDDTVKEIAGLKGNLLTELELLAEEQEAILSELQANAGNRSRLDTLVAYLTPAADECFGSIKEEEPVEPRSTFSPDPLLAQAVDLVQKCPNGEALERADRIFAAATGGPGSESGPAAEHSPLKSPQAASMREASAILHAFTALASRSEAVLHETSGYRDRVRELNDYIAAEKKGLAIRFEAFKAAHPQELLDLFSANSPRLVGIETSIHTIEPLREDEWYGRWKPIFDKDAGLRGAVEFVREKGPRARHAIADMHNCLDRKYPGLTVATDGAAGAETRAGLKQAFANARGACVRKLAGALPVASTKTEMLFVLKEGYPKLKPDNVDLHRMREIAGVTTTMEVTLSGVSAAMKAAAAFPKWGRSACDEKVRFSFGRLPSILKPDEVFEITFLGKATWDEKEPCETWGMEVEVNPRGKEMPPEGFTGVGALRTFNGQSFTYQTGHDSKMTFKHVAPHEGGISRMGGIDDGLQIDLIFRTGRLGSFNVVRYLYEERKLVPDEARRLLASRVAGISPAPFEAPAAGSRPETLAAGLLLLEMLAGDVGIYFGAPEEAKPLTNAGQIKPGATVQSGQGSQAAFKTPGGASVKIGEKSRIKLAGREPAGKREIFELQEGSVEVSRKQDLPGYDDVNIRTRDGSAWATQTRYKVRLAERGTTYEVLEGTIRVTGQMLAKTDAGFQVVGKYAFQKEMDLHAGEKGIAFQVGSGQSDSPAGAALPSWVAGGKPAGAANAQEPWADPKVQALIDEWLRSATPTVAADHPGQQWRFSEWGQALGPGSIVTGAPDHPAGWTRHQSLWAVREKFDSLNLCTLGQFIERRLKGEGVEGCARAIMPVPAKGAVPAWLSTTGATQGQAGAGAANQSSAERANDAVSRARQQLAEQRRKEEAAALAEQERIAREQQAAEQRRQAEAVRAQQQARNPGFAGNWSCTLQEKPSGRSAPANFAITERGPGYGLVTRVPGGDLNARSTSVSESKVVFVQEFSRDTMTVTLQLDGDRLTGINHIDRDRGTNADFQINCAREKR
jgi:hypothetical protein